MTSRRVTHAASGLIAAFIMSLATALHAHPAATAQSATSAQPQNVPVSTPAIEPLSAFAHRLVTLTPDRPDDYFLLAEEVADAATEDAHIELARQLHALAFALQRRAAAPSDRSEAAPVVALMALEPSATTRRWLAAIAAAADPAFAQSGWAVSSSTTVSDDIAYQAATAIGLVRAGEGREARRLLERPPVRELISRYQRLLAASGLRGAMDRLERDAAQWPCAECANARVVSRQGQRGVEVRLCPTCRGNPGPPLTHAEFVLQIRFESMLLAGIQSSWAAQLLIDDQAPLRDPNPDELPKVYGVDPARPYWRNGAWSDRP